jgi:hypothetical protein
MGLVCEWLQNLGCGGKHLQYMSTDAGLFAWVDPTWAGVGRAEKDVSKRGLQSLEAFPRSRVLSQLLNYICTGHHADVFLYHHHHDSVLLNCLKLETLLLFMKPHCGCCNAD